MPFAVTTLCLTLLAIGGALFLFVSFMMAKILLAPIRMEGGVALWTLRRLTPKDLDLPYEETFFTVRDEQTPGQTLKLSAWWIPAQITAGKTAIIVHGYADSRIGGIAWAPTFRAMGFNVLAVDLRAHGRSDGRHTTAGFYERHDLSQIIDQIKELQPAATRQLVLFGVSLGAAVVGAAAELRQGRGIAAIIMDCPFSDYISAARTHGNARGMPGPQFQRLAIHLAQKISGADFMAVAPVCVIPNLPTPLMVIHGSDDLFITQEDMDAVEAAVRSRRPDLGLTEYWRPDKTHHVLAIRTDPAEFRRRIEEFLAASSTLGQRAVREISA